MHWETFLTKGRLPQFLSRIAVPLFVMYDPVKIYRHYADEATLAMTMLSTIPRLTMRLRLGRPVDILNQPEVYRRSLAVNKNAQILCKEER